MKKQFRLALSVFAFLTAPTLFAQSSNFLHVKIPFDFVVSGQKLPAGDYTIEESGNAGAVMIKGAEAHQSAIVIGEPDSVAAEATPGLRFERRNGEVHLVRVISGSGPARVFPVH